MAPPLINMPRISPTTPVALVTVFLLNIWLCAVQSVELNLFYPFGQDNGDKTMTPADDASSIDVRVQEGFFLYNKSYRNIYVNVNGHVSFDSEFPAYRVDMALPLGYHLVAPFYADVDTRGIGRIYYRNTTDSDVVQRAAADIQTYFSGFQDYMPSTLFIVTWDRVGYFDAKSDLTNTFQLILASDGRNTFALFHYLDNGINWQRSDGKFSPNYPDIPPQAGFDGGDGGNHYLLPGSGETGAFVTGSNVNVPGVWMFHIGNIQDGNVRPADLNTGEVSVTVFKPKSQSACDKASAVCHVNAKCVENVNGFCCECIKPFYGNGFACLTKGTPQTINSRLSGQVNGVTFGSSVFMHTYAVTTDGRTYSAISQVPPSIATAMQTLNSIGGIMGWLFANPINPLAKNGYSMTGGKFNRTARVTFQNPAGADQVIHIKQVFLGHQAPNSLKMETIIQGEMPDIPMGAKVKIDDYMENYRKTGRGLITSTTARTYRVNDVARRYTWENTITFDECDDGQADQGPTTLRLSVGKHYVRHNQDEQVVRYAMTSKIGLAGGADPCESLGKPCHRNAECKTRGDAYQCECNSGYYGNGATCLDVDECRQNICDRNARCQNLPGSYRCQCNPGYRGDGRTCQPEVSLCGSSVCDGNARCVFDPRANERVCECNQGYRGDGQRCSVVETNCRTADICGDNAECVFDDVLREYVCECLDDFSGDGYSCEAMDPGCDACDPQADCVRDTFTFKESCQCKPGFTGSGRQCNMLDTCSKCHARAQCVFDDRVNQYRCICQRGYRGDGQGCEMVDCRNETGMCAPEGGLCWLNPQNNIAICRCNIGYRGDGFRCERVTCDVYNDCDVNAKCVVRGDEYTCECNEGFFGTGKRCRPDQDTTCDVYNDCDANARCTPDSSNPPNYSCRCNPGYEGDGKRCRARASCNEANFCDRNAACVHNTVDNTYDCVCNDGFRGNGRQCMEVDVTTCTDYNDCDRNARCMPSSNDPTVFMCQCNPGFRGTGKRCDAIDETCTDYNDCDKNARCMPDEGDPTLFMCQCNEGFRGTGKRCQEIEANTCPDYNDCDKNARCMPNADDPAAFTCQCNPGFRGNGKQCEEEEDIRCQDYNDCDRNARCAPDANNQTVFICQCHSGFRGNGKRCQPVEDIRCKDYNDCDRNARCLPHSSDQSVFMCQCNAGFRGNGKRCEVIEDPTCTTNNDCDGNARCVSDPNNPTVFTCRCNPGFRGNGKQCAPMPPASCKQVNNCDQNAACVLNPSTTTYQCVCNRGFVGNGLTCQQKAVPDCRRNPNLCSRDANCVQGSGSNFVCVCKQGYRGNGATCSYVVSEGEALIYAQGAKLMRVSVNPQPGDMGQQIAYLSNQMAVGIDVDCQEQKIYWSDVANGVIRRADMQGNNMEDIVKDLKSPEGVAIDHVARNMFYTDSVLDIVQVSSLDGTSVTTLVDTNMVNPRAIVLDIARGTIFWTDWNRNKPQIEKINMDGSDRTVLVYNDLRLPNGLAFDSFSQLLCWGDAGEKRIECVMSDGTGRRVVTAAASYPFDVTMLNNNIYWSDWKTRDIPNVNQNGGALNNPLTLAIGGHGRLYGIAAVRKQCPRVRNACGVNNGGCSFLCLATPSGGRTCACPDGTDPRLC